MATVRSLYKAALPDIKSFPEYILNRVQEHGAKIALVCIIVLKFSANRYLKENKNQPRVKFYANL